MITAEELLAHPVDLIAYMASFRTNWVKAPSPHMKKVREAKERQHSADLAERVPQVLAQIERYLPGQTVNKRIIATTRGWHTGVNEAFELALERGLVVKCCGGKKYRRTNK